jgi:hypothetical protein
MSYTITHANGANPIVINEGTVDTSTSIALVGRNTPSYGQYLDQNFLNILENFSNSSSPSNPISGQLWYNSATSSLKIYNGTTFKNVSSATSGVSQPTSPNIGDFWWDTANQQLDVYNGTSWVVVGPINTGAVVAEVITDTSLVNHSVVSFKISNIRFAILSSDQTFTPQSPGIIGFSTISPGMNIASASFVNNNRFVGTATNSDALGYVQATSFMRSDQNTSTIGVLSVQNNSGINIGTSNQTSINVTSNELRLDNTASNSIIRLRANINGTQTSALNVLANADVQITGNLIASGFTAFINGNSSSTTTTSGALQVGGGVGIIGNINTGGSLNTMTGLLSVGNLVITGGTLSVNAINASSIAAGTIGNTGASLVGTVNTAAQPNITSVGILTGLQVSGTTGFTSGTVTFNPTSSNKLILGSVSYIQITGGSSGSYLSTDGSGNLSWTNITIPTIPTIPGSSVAGGGAAGQVAIYSNSNAVSGSSGLTYSSSTLSVTGNITSSINNIVRGKIGVGSSISNPTYPITVSASVSVAVPAYDWVANPTQAAIYGSITGYNAGNTAPISIYASDRIIATEFNAYSDARIKNIIGTINTADSLQFVANINPIHYQIKNHIDDGDKFGFIAQDLIKLGFGNMVGHVPDSELEETTDSDGFTSPAGIKLTVDYIQVIPLLTSAIKELNNQIQELKSQVAALTSK